MKKSIVLVLVLVLAGLYALSTSTHTAETKKSIQQQQSASYLLTGKPTITAEHINRILQQAGSPARGTGKELFLLGVHYGIDPIYALAFFQHESSFGLAGVARFTRGLGNIRCTPGYSCYQGYRMYGSWEEGYKDWYKLLSSTVYIGSGLQTVEQIIPRYAPAADNNDERAYIAAIEQSVNQWRTEQ